MCVYNLSIQHFPRYSVIRDLLVNAYTKFHIVLTLCLSIHNIYMTNCHYMNPLNKMQMEKEKDTEKSDKVREKNRLLECNR